MARKRFTHSRLFTSKVAAAAAVATLGIGAVTAISAGNLSSDILQAHRAAAVVVPTASASTPSVNPRRATSTPTSQTSRPANGPLQGTRHGDAGSGPPDQSGSASNLEVVIPPTPTQNALPGLCTAFLTGRDTQTASNSSQGPPAYHLLIGATGGTMVTTTAWCREYLRLNHPGTDKARVDH
jgi:hypothetical protein